MSEICIGIISNFPINRIDEFKNKILDSINNKPVGVFFDLDYIEPFISKYNLNNCFLFSVSNDFRYNNCEIILLPDWCEYNNRKNPIPFEIRLEYISDIIQIFTNERFVVDLFLGDSGTKYEFRRNKYQYSNAYKNSA